MPRVSAQEPVQQKPIAELLMPFGHGGIVSVYTGRLDIELTVYCHDYPPTVREVRAVLLKRAEEAVAALEAGGYEVHETRITLTRPPVKCDVRIEASDR